MAYWGQTSGMDCLDWAVESVIDEAWTHHIPRLMVLSNLAQLMDIEPRQLTDWFHAAFIDAFDWVVEPNVLGMGTFALGDAMMTKPYVSGTCRTSRKWAISALLASSSNEIVSNIANVLGLF